MSKRVALLLFGISYLQKYKNRHGTFSIDYRKSLDNYKDYIWSYFADYNIDVFLCTNPSDIEDQLLTDYKPIAHKFINGDRRCKILDVIDLCSNYSEENSISYDIVVLTRFDLHFI